MKLALVQMTPRPPRDSADLGWLRELTLGLARLGVDMVVLPELLLPGYNQPAAHRDMAQPLDGEWSRELSLIARQAQIAIAYGWAEWLGDAVYNAASVIGPDGARLAHYRKMQLFGGMERDSFAPGTATPPVFDFKGRRMGMLVCYDIEFPEHARDVARGGAELLIVPTANPAGYDHVQNLLVPARASENAMTVAYANYCGADGDLSFGGGSVIAGPDGRALASAGATPAILIADIPARADYPARSLSTQLDELRMPKPD